ncbi:ribonuclease 3 [Endomicrobiia bacterium]|nr:ribonuclease 3 [Endomicrobiia bacterium]
MLSKNHEKLQKVIEYKFNDPGILITALTHKSYVARIGTKGYNNERMEFLGDSILAAIVAEALYTQYPSEAEGVLSQLKAQLVSASNLCDWAKKIYLGDYVFLGRGENTKKEARQTKNLLSDVFEAVVGAIYLDGGFENSKKFVLKFLDVQEEIISQDYKSRLQEFSQSVYRELPEYKTIREFGPDHDRRFEVAVYVHKMLLGEGTGSSRKEAQQSAAKQAMENIKQSAHI